MRPVDVALFENGIIGIGQVGRNEVANLLIAALLLFSKLIAGKTKHLERLIFQVGR